MSQKQKHQENHLTLDTLKLMKSSIERGDIAEFYAFMYANGYRYAKLAEGVYLENTMAGNVALEYMQHVADGWGQELNKEKIKEDMALGYIDTLIFIAENNEDNPNVLTRDINFDEMKAFHNDTFEKNGITKEAWTLYSLSENMSDKELDIFHEQMLDSAGNFPKEMLLSMKTSAIIAFDTFDNARNPMNSRDYHNVTAVNGIFNSLQANVPKFVELVRESPQHAYAFVNEFIIQDPNYFNKIHDNNIAVIGAIDETAGLLKGLPEDIFNHPQLYLQSIQETANTIKNSVDLNQMIETGAQVYDYGRDWTADMMWEAQDITLDDVANRSRDSIDTSREFLTDVMWNASQYEFDLDMAANASREVIETVQDKLSHQIERVSEISFDDMANMSRDTIESGRGKITDWFENTFGSTEINPNESQAPIQKAIESDHSMRSVEQAITDIDPLKTYLPDSEFIPQVTGDPDVNRLLYAAYHDDPEAMTRITMEIAQRPDVIEQDKQLYAELALEREQERKREQEELSKPTISMRM